MNRLMLSLPILLAVSLLLIGPVAWAQIGQEPSSYERLEDVSEKIDIVNIFRRSQFAGPIVDSAIRLGVRCVWMQEGVRDDEAAARARQAGVGVVMDRCILKDHRRLLR